VTLLAFAAERRAVVSLLPGARPSSAVDRHLPHVGPTAANPPHTAAEAQDGTDRQSDRQTDGRTAAYRRTPYRHLDHAVYYANSVNNDIDQQGGPKAAIDS